MTPRNHPLRNRVWLASAVAALTLTAGTSVASASSVAGPAQVSKDLQALLHDTGYEAGLLNGGHLNPKVLSELKAAAATVTSDQAKLDADLGLTPPDDHVGPEPLATFTGTGSENLPGFTIPRTAKSWGLDWWVSGCQVFDFGVVINGGNGGDVGPSPNGPLGQTTAHGSDVYYDTGSFEFQVISSCDWTMKVYD